jgi:hypothetical protein
MLSVDSSCSGMEPVTGQSDHRKKEGKRKGGGRRAEQAEGSERQKEQEGDGVNVRRTTDEPNASFSRYLREHLDGL